jgi:hypothetical protein
MNDEYITKALLAITAVVLATIIVLTVVSL